MLIIKYPTWYEGPFVGGESQAHGISRVSAEGGGLLPCLYVPLRTGHVSRGGEDLTVVNKPAAGQVARVSWQLPWYLQV